jgi:hypothetical protein
MRKGLAAAVAPTERHGADNSAGRLHHASIARIQQVDQHELSDRLRDDLDGRCSESNDELFPWG